MQQKRSLAQEFTIEDISSGIPRKRRLLSDFFKDLKLDSKVPKECEVFEDIDAYEPEDQLETDKSLGLASGRKYYISNKYFDPLLGLKKDLFSQKQAYDKIILERRRNERLSGDEEPEFDEDLMDLDDFPSSKRQKTEEVTNGELYRQMYLDKLWAMVKYENPKELLYMVWQRWFLKNFHGSIDIDGRVVALPYIEEVIENEDEDEDMMDLDD